MKKQKPTERKFIRNGKKFSVALYPDADKIAHCPCCATAFHYRQEGDISLYRRARKTDGGTISYVVVQKLHNQPVCFPCGRKHKLFKEPFDGIKDFLKSFKRKDVDDETFQAMPWLR